MSIVQAMMWIVAQQPAWWASNWLLNNLVSCYQVNNNATDETGTSNGTATNVTYSSSIKIEGSHSGTFSNWSNSKISTNQALSWYSALSLAVWVYPTAQVSTSLYEIMNDRAWGGASTAITMFKDSSSGFFGNVYVFQVRTTNNSTTWLTLTLAEVPLNTWTHLVLTYDWSNVKLYRNGSFDSQYSQSGSLSTVANLHIWSNAALTWRSFTWNIDQACIYDVAIDSTKISDLYNSWSWLAFSSFTS